VLVLAYQGGTYLDGFITNVHMFKEALCHRQQGLSAEQESIDPQLKIKQNIIESWDILMAIPPWPRCEPVDGTTVDERGEHTAA